MSPRLTTVELELTMFWPASSGAKGGKEGGGGDGDGGGGDGGGGDGGGGATTSVTGTPTATLTGLILKTST